MKVSEHFALSEFLPKGMDESTVPNEIVNNILLMAVTLLEPLRTYFDVPVAIHSGYRLPGRNAAIGGAPGSDHQRGAAADFHVWDSAPAAWEENTIAAFHWLRINKAGDYGQLILEDHRAHYGIPGKLWVHVALRGERHDGTARDRNRILVSYAPKQYEIWREMVA